MGRSSEFAGGTMGHAADLSVQMGAQYAAPRPDLPKAKKRAPEPTPRKLKR